MCVRGTSPRTRGKQDIMNPVVMPSRNIPAHAGKTAAAGAPQVSSEEHPRARGENLTAKVGASYEEGTSPRTRGKPMKTMTISLAPGNIPAHAGKTILLRKTVTETREHPRARGENSIESLGFIKPDRNIPAHAGKTPCLPWCSASPTEHPRARGENSRTFTASTLVGGTSPRTRGKRCYQ